jgi:hypothetical protein
MGITDTEIALLQIIDRVTKDNEGQNPTLAEIALAAGMSSSSRGSIQRQLSKLRPTYVDWSGRARSLHLTPAGLALLGRSVTEFAVQSPIPDVIVPLLAAGLTRLKLHIETQMPLQAPYDSAWERGSRMLVMECLIRGYPPPTHIGEVIDQWCRIPPIEWPLPLSPSGRFYQEPLIDEDNEITTLCRELAQGLSFGDAELELNESLMAQVRTLAQARRNQQGYVVFRRYLIEHPIATQDELSEVGSLREMSPFAASLHEMYERIPATAIHNAQLYLCGHCGWTLEHVGAQLKCGGPRCATLTENFSRGTTIQAYDASDPPLRVRRAIRQYIVAPGVYELHLSRQIEALGLTCVLWPFYDQYDLQVIFDNGEVWAIDVKDWKYPHLLGRSLTTFQDITPDWKQAFFAIPDARVAENPTYLLTLRNLVRSDEFTILTISQLLKEIKNRKEQNYA